MGIPISSWRDLMESMGETDGNAQEMLREWPANAQRNAQGVPAEMPAAM